MSSTNPPDSPSYAPKSPDLSAFYPKSSTSPGASRSSPHAQQIPPALALDTTARKSSGSSSYHPPPASAPAHRHHPYQHPSHHERQEAYVPPRSASFGSRPPVPFGGYPTPVTAPGPVQAQPYYPVPQHAPHSAGPSGFPTAAYGQVYPDPDQSHFSSPTAAPGPAFPHPPDHTMPTRRQAAVAAAAQNQELAQHSDEAYEEPPSEEEQKPDLTLPKIEPGVVRTKFPTARIKRIMQADEEVGKVAQQTPIAVGKALELFMMNLVTKSADIAQEKGSKRVTANMLKQVVETDEQWDFLREIVGKVEAEKEGKGKAKVESESEEESFAPKKKGRGPGRKKKSQE